MIACFDVHYEANSANAAAILFEDWHDDTIMDQLVVQCSAIEPYQAASHVQSMAGKHRLPTMLKAVE